MKIQFHRNEKLVYLCIAGFVMTLLLAGMLLNWQGVAFTSNMLLVLSVVLGLLFFLEVYILCIEKEEKYILEKKRVRSVWRMSMQIVQTLVKTIDAKDSYTNGHSARVAQYSGRLAKRSGFKEGERGRLEYTARLHDVGKIGVSDAILNKKGKLTEEEYAIIKEHSEIGAQILSTITELPDVAVGARYHHERYDGKGYPDGLKGEEIPLFARIIAVADSYDAMTSKRSYRDALPQELVRQEITRGIGTQFDPRIAKLMLIIMDEDKAYKLREIE